MTWSDGEPFTAEDVIFTWKWLVGPANLTAAVGQYEMIAGIIAEDDLTVTITYATPQPDWYIPFTGTNWGAIYPKHNLDGGGQTSNEAIALKPIGTGPFVMDLFAVGDQVVYAANKRYRDPAKPFFSRVILKGWGDASSSARAVLQTGEYEFAPALQLEPEVLSQIESTGDKGKVVIQPGSNMERLVINFADPHKDVDGERAHLASSPITAYARHSHWRSTSRRWQTSSFSRANSWPRTSSSVSPSSNLPTTSGSTIRAKPTGYSMRGMRDRMVRKKDGIELAATHATPVNAVRQKTQQVIKANWEAIGVRTEPIEIDSSIYFDGSPGNEQSMRHFYNDVQMWSNGLDIPFPLNFMLSWYASPNNENVAQKSNDWFGGNQQRYVNPEFDALFDEAGTETDPQRLVEIFVRMNDIVVQDVAGILLIQRSSAVFAIANKLDTSAITPSSFGLPYWNIANWKKTT